MESIIASDWCNVCFNNEYCVNITREMPSPCSAFAETIKNYPSLVCPALDRHIVKEGPQQRFDFSPLEFLYFRRDRHCGTALPALSSAGLYADTQVGLWS